MAALSTVAAQPAARSEQPVSAFSANSGRPVTITSKTAEFRDKINEVRFIDDVKLVQGDMTITCRTLVAFYDESPSRKDGAKKPAASNAQARTGQNQQLKHAECKGNVLVVQKDQAASGDLGVYDTKANTVTLTGSVVLTQGQKIMRGDSMVLDLTTGVTTIKQPQALIPGTGAPSSPTAAAAPAVPKATPKARVRTD